MSHAETLTPTEPWHPAGRTTALAPAQPAPPAVPSPAAPAPSQPQAPTVQISLAAPPPIVITGGDEPGLFVRLLWMCFVGWWLGPLVAVTGWVLLLPVLTMPLGIAILDRTPAVTTLQRR